MASKYLMETSSRLALRLAIYEDEIRRLDSKKVMYNITNLPPEILLQIFGYLSLEDLLDNIQHVCIKWRELAQHPSLWEDLQYCPLRSTCEETVEFVAKCPMLKHIRTCISGCSKLREGLVTTIIKNCSDIRTFCVHFQFGYLTYSDVNALFEAYPNLECFEITTDCPGAVQIVGKVSKSTNIKNLIVNGDSWCNDLFRPIADGCISLNHLCIENISIPENDLLYILQNTKDRLSCLQLSDSQLISHKMVKVLGTFTKLQELTFTHTAGSGQVNYLPMADIRTVKCLTFTSYAERISDVNTFFDVMFHHPFPLLRKLAIIISAFQSDRAVLNYICECYPNLKCLHLHKHPHSKGETFEYISRLKQLENLEYSVNETLTDNDIKHIARCRKLKHLKMFNCTNLLPKTFHYLIDCKLLESLILHNYSLSTESVHLISQNLKQLKILEVGSLNANKKSMRKLAELTPLLKIQF